MLSCFRCTHDQSSKYITIDCCQRINFSSMAALEANELIWTCFAHIADVTRHIIRWHHLRSIVTCCQHLFKHSVQSFITMPPTDCRSVSRASYLAGDAKIATFLANCRLCKLCGPLCDASYSLRIACSFRLFFTLYSTIAPAALVALCVSSHDFIWIACECKINGEKSRTEYFMRAHFLSTSMLRSIV